jgi:hypothetical protein
MSYFYLSAQHSVSWKLLDKLTHVIRASDSTLIAAWSAGETTVKEVSPERAEEYRVLEVGNKNPDVSPGYTKFRMVTWDLPVIPENLFERIRDILNEPGTGLSAWLEPKPPYIGSPSHDDDRLLCVNHSDIRDRQAEIDQDIKRENTRLKKVACDLAIEQWAPVFEEAGFHMYDEMNDSGLYLNSKPPGLIRALGLATKEWLKSEHERESLENIKL